MDGDEEVTARSRYVRRERAFCTRLRFDSFSGFGTMLPLLSSLSNTVIFEPYSE